MPGPVSDSYDPEFGTGERASVVRDAVEEVRNIVSLYIGDSTLREIIGVCESKNGRRKELAFSERELRIIRFAMNRALESL